jgi:hypothetical protein
MPAMIDPIGPGSATARGRVRTRAAATCRLLLCTARVYRATRAEAEAQTFHHDPRMPGYGPYPELRDLYPLPELEDFWGIGPEGELWVRPPR